MMAMLKRAVKFKFEADYVLTDSWFYNHELVKLVSRLNKKTTQPNFLSKFGKTKCSMIILIVNITAKHWRTGSYKNKSTKKHTILRP